MDFPVVIKVGGSLVSHFTRLSREIARAGTSALVVTGGGAFADAVRQQDPPADEAHWMAIAAMEQNGWLFSSNGIPATDRLHMPRGPAVLLPYRVMREEDPLPHTWEVTSDTIAAWVALKLCCTLVVVKSVDGIMDQGGLARSLGHAVGTEVVDPSFIGYVLENNVSAFILNGRVPGRLYSYLTGREVKGTGIGDLLSGHRKRI